MRIDNQFMRRVINMNILTEDHDFILITEQGCNLLERHPFRLGKVKPRPYGAKTGYDDEDLRVKPVSTRVYREPGVIMVLPGRTSNRYLQMLLQSPANKRDR
jgi:hypothetical protein